MIFVDTVAWGALLVPSDPHHLQVVQFTATSKFAFITTDYVIDETLTFLRGRRLFSAAVEMGHRFFDLNQVRIEYLSPADIRQAWELFRSQPQRAWSFTDCTSKVIIERYHIKQALTFDQHFREFGNLTLVP